MLKIATDVAAILRLSEASNKKGPFVLIMVARIEIDDIQRGTQSS
jgi:hypothetical protein